MRVEWVMAGRARPTRQLVLRMRAEKESMQEQRHDEEELEISINRCLVKEVRSACKVMKNGMILERTFPENVADIPPVSILFPSPVVSQGREYQTNLPRDPGPVWASSVYGAISQTRCIGTKCKAHSFRHVTNHFPSHLACVLSSLGAADGKGVAMS